MMNQAQSSRTKKVTARVRKAMRAMRSRIPKPDLSLPAKVYQANRYLYPHGSEQEAMRGDWEKIGDDFRVSIAKAERETAAE
jgi:hypothetical protein